MIYGNKTKAEENFSALQLLYIFRYLAIRFPILHKTKVNMRSSRAVVAVSWIIGIIIGLLPLLGWNTIDWSQSSNTNEGCFEFVF